MKEEKEELKKAEKELINIRMDSTLKRQFEDICSELGFTITTAITTLAKQMIRDRKLPFLPDAGKNDNIIIDIQNQNNEENVKNIKRLLEYQKKFEELDNKNE